MSIVIQNISQLVTSIGSKAAHGPEMSAIKEWNNVDVWIQDGLIQKILPSKSKTPPWEEYRLIDAENAVATPGMIDPHTHIPFFGFRYNEFYQRAQGKSYMEIMKSGGGILHSSQQVRKASVDEIVDFNLPFTRSMLHHGVTVFEGKSGYGLNSQAEIKQLYALQRMDQIIPQKVCMTFLGAHAVPKEFLTADEYLDMVIHEMLPEVLARFPQRMCVDIFCEEGVFTLAQSRRFLERAKELGFDLKIHAEEIAFLGGSILGCELGALSVEHLIQISEEGIQTLSKSQTVAVLLPGTSFFLKKPFAPARKLIDKGAAVALATDFNPGSCPILAPSLIANLAANHFQMTAAEILTAMTLNAAAALGISQGYGTLEEGKKAHLILWDLPDYSAFPYLPGHDRVISVFIEDQFFPVKDFVREENKRRSNP